MPAGPHPPQGALGQPSGPHPGDTPRVGSAPHLRGKIPHPRTNRAAGRSSSTPASEVFLRAAGRSSSTPASEVFLRRPGGVLLPLPPRSFSGGRAEFFYPCLRGLSPAAGRSPSTPASRPSSGASTRQPYGAFYRTAGKAAGGSPAPRSDAVRRGLRRAGATTKPQR